MTYIVTVLEARVEEVRTRGGVQMFEGAGASPSLGVFEVAATLPPPEGT